MTETDKYHEIVTENIFLLIARGFDEKAMNTAPQNTPFLTAIEDKFKLAVLAAIDSKRPESFFVETNGLAGDPVVPIYYKFHFQFDPLTATLNIPALYANMGTTEIIYTNQVSTDLPTTKSILKDLNDRKLQKAVNIITKTQQGQNNPSQSKKHL